METWNGTRLLMFELGMNGECLSRCRHLVEVCGEDVTKGDGENITVLHWAAINNRIAVASYLIQVSSLPCGMSALSASLCRKEPTRM